MTRVLSIRWRGGGVLISVLFLDWHFGFAFAVGFVHVGVGWRVLWVGALVCRVRFWGHLPSSKVRNRELIEIDLTLPFRILLSICFLFLNMRVMECDYNGGVIPLQEYYTMPLWQSLQPQPREMRKDSLILHNHQNIVTLSKFLFKHLQDKHTGATLTLEWKFLWRWIIIDCYLRVLGHYKRGYYRVEICILPQISCFRSVSDIRERNSRFNLCTQKICDTSSTTFSWNQKSEDFIPIWIVTSW